MAVAKKKKAQESKSDLRNAEANAQMRSTPITYEMLNMNELLHICKRIGVQAHRGVSKNDLIKLIEGTIETGEKNPIDIRRDQLIAFMKLYWDRVKNQLPDHCSGNCYECSDIKVLDCFRENRELLFKSRR